MALTYGFYNSVGGDRTYDARDVSQLFDGLISDGVFSTIGDMFATKPGTGLQVTVGTGRAWFNHTWTLNDSAMPLNLATADLTLSRIDAVVLQIREAAAYRDNSIVIVKGTASSNPQRPSLTNTSDFHQYPLAYVTVPAKATSITNANIANVVGSDAKTPLVTGMLRQQSITDVFIQWQGEFEAWFANLQAQLTNNVVTNLQNQINNLSNSLAAKVNVSDKASAAEVTAGTNDTKWVTPSGVKAKLDAYSKEYHLGEGFSEIGSITKGGISTTGSVLSNTFTLPVSIWEYEKIVILLDGQSDKYPTTKLKFNSPYIVSITNSSGSSTNGATIINYNNSLSDTTYHNVIFTINYLNSQNYVGMIEVTPFVAGYGPLFPTAIDASKTDAVTGKYLNVSPSVYLTASYAPFTATMKIYGKRRS